MESLGVKVERISVREPSHEIVDPQDVREASRTHYLLASSVWRHCADFVKTALQRPGRFLRAARFALRLARRSDSGAITHLAYFVEACGVFCLCRKRRVEHLHVHFCTNPAAVAAICRVLGGPPFSITVHGPNEFDRSESLAVDEKIRLAKFVAAISQFTRAQLYRWTPSEHWAKIHIVRCGVSERFLSHVLTPVPDVNRFVSIGRLNEQKGQLVLLYAVRILRDRGIEVHIDLIGGGELEGVIREEISKYGLEAQVHLLGWRDESQIVEALLTSRALVLPSFAEGLPVVIMEALALGRPVISTYIAGIPELVRSGQTGWLVPAGESAALADALHECLTEPPTRLTRMGECGADLVRTFHNSLTETERLLAVMRHAGDAAAPASGT